MIQFGLVIPGNRLLRQECYQNLIDQEYKDFKLLSGAMIPIGQNIPWIATINTGQEKKSKKTQINGNTFFLFMDWEN